MKWALVSVFGIAAAFGAWALYLGYDTVVIAGVFGLGGSVAGYIVGKKA